MEGIRVVKLPAARMVTSGGKDLKDFDNWWSALDKERKDKFFPRDFMYFDQEEKQLIWFYALADDTTDTGEYDSIDFPGGLYAAAISKAEDDVDGKRVYDGIQEWITKSAVFALDERPGHYTMFHVVSPDEVYEALGYRQLDMYVPIKIVN